MSKGKVIPFKSKKQRHVDKESLLMIRIADEIDAVIVKHLQRGEIDPKELAGVISHRLGTFMRNLDQKNILWEFCEGVMKKQAGIKDKGA